MPPRHLLLPANDGERNRTRRIFALCAGLVILSVADLGLTLFHLHHGNMREGNPLVALLLNISQTLWVLVPIKGLTVGICLSLFYFVRHHWLGEAGAWVAYAILTLVGITWIDFTKNKIDQNNQQAIKTSFLDANTKGKMDFF